MSVFVAAAAFSGTGVASLSGRSVGALRLPGVSDAAQYAAEGFACATGRARPESTGLHVARGIVVAGDVRLDGAADLRRAIRGTAGEELAALRKRHQGGGHDLELVLAAYLAWGESAPGHLRGDFSFVVWDGPRRALLAARDGLGVRPLYYAPTSDGICASNVLNAVRAHAGVGQSLRGPAVVSFLESGWNRDTTTTTFHSIARLAPGTSLHQAMDDREPATRVHWRLPQPAPLRYRSDQEYIDHYRALLDDAVRDRLTGDTAILLSGGLDSTSIAATAARLAPPSGLWSLTLRTPAVESLDESRLAAAVAARVGIANEQRDLAISPLAETGHHTPEPHDEPEAATNRALYAEAGMRSSVVFSGEDGDGLFAPPGLGSLLRTDGVVDTVRRVAAYTIRHRHHPYMGFWLSQRLQFWKRRDGEVRPPWLSAAAGPPADEGARPLHATRPEADERLASSAWQAIHQSVDRTFLGAPLEFRWPLLDTRLIEFVFAIPAVPWCQRKHLVRRAYAGDLPAAVITRPKTSVPGYLDWLVAEWRGRTGAACPALHESTREYVEAAALANTLRQGDTEAVLAAWRALQLDRWMREEAAA